MRRAASLFCFVLIGAWLYSVYSFLVAISHQDIAASLMWMLIYGAVIPVLFAASVHVAEG